MSDGKTSAAPLLLPHQGPETEVKAKVTLHIARLSPFLSPSSVSLRVPLFPLPQSLSHSHSLALFSFSVSQSWFSFYLSCPAPSLSFTRTHSLYLWVSLSLCPSPLCSDKTLVLKHRSGRSSQPCHPPLQLLIDYGKRPGTSTSSFTQASRAGA